VLVIYIYNKASLFAQSAAHNNAPGSSSLITTPRMWQSEAESICGAISFFYGVAWLLKISEGVKVSASASQPGSQSARWERGFLEE